MQYEVYNIGINRVYRLEVTVIKQEAFLKGNIDLKNCKTFQPSPYAIEQSMVHVHLNFCVYPTTCIANVFYT